MRSTLRSLTFGLAGLLGMVSQAQQPYTWIVTGTVAGCTPNQVVTLQTIQGTQPQQTITAVVDSNCTYSAMLYVASNPSWVQASTGCNGAIVNAWDSAQFNFIMDTAYSVINLNCGSSNVYDCLQILNGPNMPGTACNDGNPATMNDVWSPNCVCQGFVPQNCQAAFSIGQLGPFAMLATNQSTGTAPFSYQWWMPDGSTSLLANPIYTFAGPGTYGICLTITAANACTSVTCDTVYVDSTGSISTQPNYYDCIGYPNGPNLPGTPCNDGNPVTINDTWNANCGCVGTGGGTVDCYGIPGGPNLPGTACVDSIGGLLVTGIWSANCMCQTSVNQYDCLQILNGPNMPGTPCDDGDSLTTQDTWTPNCACVGVTFGYYDCLGQLNGPALPGTPCNDNNPATLNDTWNANCGCVGGGTTPCNADFWVLQGFTVDSMNTPTPIPYELWVWNLTSGGSGTYTSYWSFGDGTSSTDPFPTHTYSGNGPYILCLTINDGAGCTSTYCDTVSIDGNGLYTGMIGGGTDRQNGFTLNVQNALTAGVVEVQVAGNIALWPNPVANDLNIALTDALAGAVEVTVLDLNGRIVVAERRALSNGRNQLTVPTSKLTPGLYTVRIGNGAASISQRFVKVD